MLSDASEFMFNAPRLAIWPGVSIMFVVFAFNFLGDGPRDILDPRQDAKIVPSLARNWEYVDDKTVKFNLH